MARGDSREIKYQLYKKNIGNWVGMIHENFEFYSQPTLYDLLSLKVYHKNALDNFSKNLKKTFDGFIILEDCDENSDSYKRNLLYESLTYRIIHENLPHKYRGYLLKHYEINKTIIDKYYQKAINLWKK